MPHYSLFMKHMAVYNTVKVTNFLIFLCKHEFVPRDQVSPLFVVYCLLILLKINSFAPVLSIRTVLNSFFVCSFSILRNSQFESDVSCLPHT